MPLLPPVVDPLVGQTVGGYVVEYALGEGAMGLVYRVRHPVLNRHFAIKVLRPEVAADAISSSNFVREAEVLSKLKHPSIIDIVDFGPVGDGRQYMVMEYLVGRTLERELLEEGRLEPERALKLSDEILDALSAAHSVDVIHRDLKPSNVFLARVSGGREVVKLLDFGLARQTPVALEQQGAAAAHESGIAGTPEYIAPEQACGQSASKQSDLYSFGVMLFRMLTGSLPFKVDYDLPDSQQVLALMKKHVHQAPPTIHEAAGDVTFPEGLDEILADLLKKKPSERPSSAETVRKRLQRAYRSLQQEATQLRPNPLPPVVIEPAPRAQKRRGVLRGGTLALLLGMAGAWWWWGGRALPESPAPAVAEAAPTPPPVTESPAGPPVGPTALEPPPVFEPAEVLTALTAIARPPPQKVKRPTPVPAAPPPLPACAPDAQWKLRARADLNELETRASRSNADLVLWAADQERPLSAAIEAATSDAECRAVGLQLAAFKQKVTGT